MKCIGLVGVDGTDSAMLYRRRLEREVARRWGHRYVQSIITMDLQIDPLSAAMKARDWNAMAEQIRLAAIRLAGLGAKGIVLCSSILHIGPERLNLKLPILHIADATLSAVRGSKIKRLGLLGTRYREEDLFWRARFHRGGFPDVFVPTEADREKVTDIVVNELRRGVVRMSSAAELTRVIYSLRVAGAKSVIFAVPDLVLALTNAEAVLHAYDARECQISAVLNWVKPARERKNLAPGNPDIK